MRLLLVENDTLSGDRLRTELEQAGFAVDVATDGVGAPNSWGSQNLTMLSCLILG
ncbi:MAG: hypothetical protein KDJ22_05585 [Candidatus Competibacteraceae bacterium]|nr:hypothetical protein [Candidatus Competibacteraceae bacterium]MCB1771765.1 hypothetical protein [Candidatus Competibacteraceae bacterium]MCP5125691.1 hypothetical protein [Gammaproteobacteria bacterium]HRX71142.1 hypothetical protein [Candidatus Competibacteraceae bacterium]